MLGEDWSELPHPYKLGVEGYKFKSLTYVVSNFLINPKTKIQIPSCDFLLSYVCHEIARSKEYPN